MRFLLPILTASAIAPLAGAALTQPAVEKPEPRVSFPPRARIGDVLRGLEATGDGVSVADASSQEGTLGPEGVAQAPLGEALKIIGRDLDRFWVRKGRVLVLQRKFSDPEEEPELELEEVRQVTSDLYRLVQPVVPRRLDEQFIHDQDNFTDSLTPELQQLLVNRGMRLAELPPAHRAAWLRINTAQAYAPTALELERAARCLERWDQASLVDWGTRERRELFNVVVPDATTEDGEMRCRLQLARVRRSAAPNGEGIELPSTQALVAADLRSPLTILPTRLRLGDLVERMAAEGGPRIQVPSYARGRQIWISSRGGTRGEVLDALAVLWGWELAPARDGYTLGRPALPRPRNPLELHLAMRRVVPPALIHSLRRGHVNATDRMARQLELVIQDADPVGGREWMRVEVKRLSALAQQRLANCAALAQLAHWYGEHGSKPPQEWLTHPERAVLSLSAPIGPDNHPLLKFSVYRMEGNKQVEEFWGWWVNTSSFKQKR